jgi:cytochrome P450
MKYKYNGTVLLLAHPDQRDALVADPGLVPRAVEEMLRIDPPAHRLTDRSSSIRAL